MNKNTINKKTDKPDYQKFLEAELARIAAYNTDKSQPKKAAQNLSSILKVSADTNPALKPSLLLHACCAPCSSYVIEYLHSFFDITIFYYNPNIYPETEYTRRLTELTSFLNHFEYAKRIQLYIPPYEPEEYFEQIRVKEEPSLQFEAERGERCRRCYYLRMKKAFSYAVQHGFNYVTTTLSISPYKDAEKINIIGKELESSFKTHTNDSIISAMKNPIKRHSVQSPRFLYADFKKKNGFKRSLELSAEYGLYRQDYCGCIYSIRSENFQSSNLL